MPKRRGTRCALRVAADSVNCNPAAPVPLPQWVTRLLDWFTQVRILEELESIERNLVVVLEAVRRRISDIRSASEMPASQRRR